MNFLKMWYVWAGLVVIILVSGVVVTSEILKKPVAEMSEIEGGSRIETLTFCADWPSPWIEWVVWEYPERMGYYREEGIHLVVERPSLPSESLKMVATGWCDVGYNYQLDVVHLASEKDAPIVAIASYFHKSKWGIAFYETDTIKTPKDLASAWIGIYNLFSDNVLFKAWRKQFGISDKTLFLVDNGLDGVKMLEDSKVDAIGVWGNSGAQLLWARDANRKVAFYPLDSNVYLSVMVANTEFMSHHQKLLARFLRATNRGMIDLMNHPAKILDVIDKDGAPLFPSSVDTKVLKILLAAALSTSEPRSLGRIDCSRWKDSLKRLDEMGVLTLNLSKAEDLCFPFLDWFEKEFEE